MINIPMNTKPPVSLSDMAGGTSPVNSGMNQSYTQPVNNGMNQGYTQSMNNGMDQGYTQPVNNGMNQSYTQPVNNGMNQGYTQPVNNGMNQGYTQPVNNGMNQGYTQPVNATPVQSAPTPRPAATGVILQKGQKTSLAKFGNALENIEVGLGWDVSDRGVYDLDAECFILGDNDKVIGDSWFVYYNQPASPDGAIRHSGDNKNGAGVGDDEVISIRLSQVNPQAKKLVFVVTINEAKQRNLNFSGVQNAYIRLVDKDTSRELCRFNLTEYYSNVTSMVVAELYRHNGEWKMNPVGDGVQADLFDLCMRYGVNVAG